MQLRRESKVYPQDLSRWRCSDRRRSLSWSKWKRNRRAIRTCRKFGKQVDQRPKSDEWKFNFWEIVLLKLTHLIVAVDNHRWAHREHNHKIRERQVDDEEIRWCAESLGLHEDVKNAQVAQQGDDREEADGEAEQWLLDNLQIVKIFKLNLKISYVPKWIHRRKLIPMRVHQEQHLLRHLIDDSHVRALNVAALPVWRISHFPSEVVVGHCRIPDKFCVLKKIELSVELLQTWIHKETHSACIFDSCFIRNFLQKLIIHNSIWIIIMKIWGQHRVQKYQISREKIWAIV